MCDFHSSASFRLAQSPFRNHLIRQSAACGMRAITSTRPSTNAQGASNSETDQEEVGHGVSRNTGEPEKQVKRGPFTHVCSIRSFTGSRHFVNQHLEVPRTPDTHVTAIITCLVKAAYESPAAVSV
jgi:hypothetical protein